MEIPKRLYKYRAPSVQAITSLSAAKLWIADPTSFNDPFDCAYDVAFANASREDCVALLKRISGGTLNEAACDKFTDDVLRETVTGGLKTAIRDGIDRANGVCCFSTIPNDLLMWSHYAESHTGFCLEFDTALCPIFQTAKPVKYSDDFPVLSVAKLNSGDSSQILELLLTKARNWQYEQEWRVLHTDAGLEFSYERECLTSIYFGARMSEERIMMIASLLKNSDTKLYQVRLSKSRFELLVESLTFTTVDCRETSDEGKADEANPQV